MKKSVSDRPSGTIGSGALAFSRTRRVIRIGFVLCLVCLGIIGLVSYRNTERLVETHEQVSRMQEVRAQIGAVLDAAADVQITARGYILSGRHADFQDFQDSLHFYQRSCNELQVLTNPDNYDPSSGADSSEDEMTRHFIQLTSSRLPELRADVDMRRAGKVFNSREIVRLLKSETESLSVQSRFARRFRSSEEDLLGPHYVTAGVTSYQTLKIIIFGSFGAVLVVFGALLLIDRDMLIRKAVEDRLARSEQRFRAIIENASDLITLVGRDGRVIYDSPSATRLTAGSKRNPTHFPIDNIHPEDRRAVEKIFEEVKRSPNAVLPVGFRCRDGQGRYRWMESVVSNQINVPGVGGLVIATRDVTERRQAEEAVRISEARLREAQRIAGLGTWEYDLARDRFTCSEEVFHLFGFDPAGPTPDFESYLQRIHPEMGKLASERIEEAITTGEEMEYDQTILWPDGSIRHARATLHPVRDDDTGRVVRLLGTTLDITARKEGERARETLLEELRESEHKLRQTADELARSNRELSAFATVASHDLQEPLRKIRTFADMIERRTAGKLDDSAADYLRRMKQSSERMQSLVESVLELSRVSTRPRKPVVVDLNRVIDEVLSDLEARIEACKGHIDVTRPLPKIEADPVPIRQLLQNLVGNALKFCSPDHPPVVTVRAEIVPPEPGDDLLNPGQGWLRLVVSDNGIGFDPAYAERIFQAFERLEDRTRYEGNGVGLAICRRIVERHGGRIVATSSPGKGATFTVTMPGALVRVAHNVALTGSAQD